MSIDIDTILREWCVDSRVLTACGYDKLRAIETEIARLRGSEKVLKKIAGLDPSQQHWAVTYARDALKQ